MRHDKAYFKLQLILSMIAFVMVLHSGQAAFAHFIGVNYNLFKPCEGKADFPGSFKDRNALQEYQKPGVRAMVQLQLAQMREGGADTVATVIYFTSTPGQRDDGVISISDQGQKNEFFKSLNEYTSDVKSAGFSRLTLRFNPLGLNSPLKYVRKWADPNNPVPNFNSDYTVTNYEFIKSVRDLTKPYQAHFFELQYDLQVEIGDTLTEESRVHDPNSYWYFFNIWKRYQTEHPNENDASGSIGLSWYDTSQFPARPVPTGVDAFRSLLKVYKTAGVGYPRSHMFMYYHSSLNRFEPQELLDIKHVMNEFNLPSEAREIRFIETFYQHGPTASTIWFLNSFRGFNIAEAAVWPMTAEDLFSNNCQALATHPYQVGIFKAVRANGSSATSSHIREAGYFAPNREFWVKFSGQVGSFPLFASVYIERNNAPAMLRSVVPLRFASWTDPTAAFTNMDFPEGTHDKIFVQLWNSDGSATELFPISF